MPAALAAEMSHADALGQQAWQEARAASDFSRFRDALARHVELRHRYVECFEPAAHPYDILLDDFEPGLTTAELRPLFATLRDELVGLVAGATGNGERRAQRRRLLRPVRGRRPAPRRDGRARGGRLRPRRLAPGPGAAPVRAVARPAGRPDHDALRPARLRRRALLRAARVRPRPLRGGHRARARARPARHPGVARHPRVPEPAVGEPRRPLAPVLRLGAAEPAPSTSARRWARSTPRRSTARSTRSSAR